MIYKANKGQTSYGEPIGIILMESYMPFPPSCPGNASTFPFPVRYEVVRGANMERLVYQGDPDLLQPFVDAGRKLVKEGVKAITGNCGFMVLYHDLMAEEFPVPVFMSSLLQLPFIHRLLKPGEKAMADANQGWRVALVDDAPLWDLPRATRFAEACAGLDVAWLEEPLDMYAWDELAELRRRARVPIAGGELNGGWHEFAVMLEKGCFDLYQPDATFGGGISDAVRVARACRERGLAFSPHTWSNGFSMMVNLHVHAACGDDHPLEYPLEPPGWIPEFRDALLAEPVLADAEGTVAIPEGHAGFVTPRAADSAAAPATPRYPAAVSPPTLPRTVVATAFAMLAFAGNSLLCRLALRDETAKEALANYLRRLRDEAYIEMRLDDLNG